MSTLGLGRWLLIIAAAACLVGLVVKAHGDEHHRGDETGAIAQVAR